MATLIASSSRSLIARSQSSLLSSLTKELIHRSTLSSTSRRLRYASKIPADHPSSHTNLRAQPWDFKSDVAPSPRTSQNKFALQVQGAADKRNFPESLNAAAGMKAAGIIPDVDTYNALISAAAEDGGQWLEAWAILDDMILVGVKPNITTFNHLIRAQTGRSSPYLWEVLLKMEELQVTPDSQTYTLIIGRFVHDENLEMALQYLFIASETGVLPHLHTAEAVVTLASNLGHPRLAMDLIRWFENKSVRRMGHSPWLSCLIASAQTFWAEGIVECWEIVIRGFKVLPDEGLCIDVLNACAQHGLVDIAQDAIQTLKSMNASLQEYHYAPVVEAAAKAGEIQSGLIVLNEMALNNVETTSLTALPMAQVIGSDLDTLDSAMSYIDEFYQQQIKLTSAPLRAVIRAAVSLDDLQRAVGMYKSFSEYGVGPDLQTYNVLFEGCTNAGHRQLGDLLLGDMKQLNIQPDQETYEHLVRLCLTQDTYEDAFFYLEEMKAAGFIPRTNIYEAIIQTCISNEDPRYTIAAQEMRECGYPIQGHLRELLKKAPAANNEEVQDTMEVMLDEASQKYIETGGVESRL